MFTGEDDIYKVKSLSQYLSIITTFLIYRWVRSVVGTRREALGIFILNRVTGSKAALESSSLRIRCNKHGRERLKTKIPKYFQDKTSISYFTPDLCRPIHFNFKEETEVMGVAGYKYMLDEGFVANSTYNVTNACYNPELDLMVGLPVSIGKRFSCHNSSALPHFFSGGLHERRRLHIGPTSVPPLAG